MTKIKKYVLTGGPGVGKSTLIPLLGASGIYTLDEVATYIIERESAKKSDILPWKNKNKFQKAVLELQLEWESKPVEYNTKPWRTRDIETVVQDRGILDGIAYYLIDGEQPPQELLEAARTADYAGVFILEPVKYKRTETRREDQERAKRLHEKIREVYESFGYRPITIPAVSPEERAERILQYITNFNAKQNEHDAMKQSTEEKQNDRTKNKTKFRI